MIKPTLLLVLLLSCHSVQAHLFELFAYTEANRIHGSAFSSGGQKAAGALIKVFAEDGHLLNSLKSNQQGDFVLDVQKPGSYRLLAESGDGHIAERFVSVVSQANPTTDKTSSAEFALPGNETSKKSTVDHHHRAQFLQQVEQAVARQVGPLRVELQHHDKHVRLANILGGIGFIFGLAGLLLWWRCRQTGKHRS